MSHLEPCDLPKEYMDRKQILHVVEHSVLETDDREHLIEEILEALTDPQPQERA